MLTAQPDQFIVAKKSHRYITFFLAFGLYFTAALYCIYIARQPDSVASAWYGNAMIIMMLQVLKYRDWPVVLVLAASANLAANLVLGDPVLMSLAFIPGNLLEIGLAAYCLRRFIPLRQCMYSPLMLLKAFAVMLLPIALNASVGGLVIAAYGLVSFTEALTFLSTGSLIGNISIVPLGILLLTYGWSGFIKVNQAFGFLMCILISLAVALLSFIYLPFPYIYISASLMIVALVGGFAATAIGVLAYSGIIGALMAIGFFQPSLQNIYHGSEIYLYVPLVITLLQPLILAAALERHKNEDRNNMPTSYS